MNQMKIESLQPRLRLFIPLVLFTLIAVFLFRALSLNPASIPSAMIGRSLPEFELPVLENERLTNNADLIGRSILINVWATWCAACVIEHPFLMRLADSGIPIYGVNYKDQVVGARKWLSDYGDPYVTNIIDQHGKLGFDLGVYGAPETFFVDANGIIQYRHVGIINEDIWTSKLARLYSGLEEGVK